MSAALSSVVTEAWPNKPFTFRALRKTFGAMWVRCDVCRRYAPLSIGGLQEVDYRSKTFSCSQCGSEAYLAVIEPIKEAGMQDYRLDAIERPSAMPRPSIGFTDRHRRPQCVAAGLTPEDRRPALCRTHRSGGDVGLSSEAARTSRSTGLSSSQSWRGP